MPLPVRTNRRNFVFNGRYETNATHDDKLQKSDKREMSSRKYYSFALRPTELLVHFREQEEELVSCDMWPEDDNRRTWTIVISEVMFRSTIYLPTIPIQVMMHYNVHRFVFRLHQCEPHG